MRGSTPNPCNNFFGIGGGTISRDILRVIVTERELFVKGFGFWGFSFWGSGVDGIDIGAGLGFDFVFDVSFGLGLSFGDAMDLNDNDVAVVVLSLNVGETIGFCGGDAAVILPLDIEENCSFLVFICFISHLNFCCKYWYITVHDDLRSAAKYSNFGNTIQLKLWLLLAEPYNLEYISSNSVSMIWIFISSSFDGNNNVTLIIQTLLKWSELLTLPLSLAKTYSFCEFFLISLIVGV